MVFYHCVAHGKCKCCPIQRINAQNLHAAVIEQIRRAAEYPTRMHEIIREVAKVAPAPEGVKDRLQAVGKRLREVEKRTKGVLAAIEAGGARIKSLLDRLTELQTQGSALQTEKYQLEAVAAESRLQRPNAVWDEGTDEEKAALLPLVVNRVALTEKERGFCRLSFSAINPRFLQKPTSEYVVNNFKLGALIRPVNTFNPPNANAPLLLPPGGRLRTREFRPGQTVTMI